MAYRWFDDDEVATSISFASIAGPIGCILGLIAGPQFIDESGATAHQVEYYLLWHGVVNTVLCLPILLFFRNHPKNISSD